MDLDLATIPEKWESINFIREDAKRRPQRQKRNQTIKINL